MQTKLRLTAPEVFQRGPEEWLCCCVHQSPDGAGDWVPGSRRPVGGGAEARSPLSGLAVCWSASGERGEAMESALWCGDWFVTHWWRRTGRVEYVLTVLSGCSCENKYSELNEDKTSRLFVGLRSSKCDCPVPFEIPECSVGQPGTVLPCVKLNDLFEGLSTGLEAFLLCQCPGEL